MRRIALGAIFAAGIMAFGLTVSPANAAAMNIGSALYDIQSKVSSDVTPVHCRRYWHCHSWGCHTCGAVGPYYRPYGYYRPYYRPYRYRYRY